jgi:hypothetical protein
MKSIKLLSIVLTLFLFSVCSFAAEDIPLYTVYELNFQGINYKSKDNPVRDIELLTTWQHESSMHTIRIYGFFDGNGKGNIEGSCFKVRFCPVEPGVWTLKQVQSNDKMLNGQHQGLQVNATQSDHPGFWEIDTNNTGNRWYKRSNGTHQYITGNTMYSFLAEYNKEKPSDGNIKDDVIGNSGYFKKIRIGITADRFPNPKSKPFLDEGGKPTDDGNYSNRPNPEWFFNRVDLAVKTAFDKDLITDLILNGPDMPESRSVLKAKKNNSDAVPFLKYIAARYGSFPNVWICLSNEYNIKSPKFSCDEIVRTGETLQKFLPYKTPVSVHGSDDWDVKLNSGIPWFDHVIIQYKLKKSDQSADRIQLNYILVGASHPVVNDELAYEGEGDGWSEEDVVEAFLGAFAGGGYASTGYKTAAKGGQYLTGNFKASAHKAADNILWFRNIIDKNISFWKMAPVSVTNIDNKNANIFRGYDTRFRILSWENNEYVMAGGSSKREIKALLPDGNWSIKSYDLISMTEKSIAEHASGLFIFNFPDSRAVLFHFKKEADH